MRFKHDIIKDDFFNLHPQVIIITCDIIGHCLKKYSIEPTISSMLRKKGQDSGVHETGRAIDISPHQYSVNGNREATLPMGECPAIADFFNNKYLRKDGLRSVIWHFGTAWHFHIQVEFDQSFSIMEMQNKNILVDRDPL